MALFGDLTIEGYVRSHGFGWNKSWSEALSVKNSTFRREVNRFVKTGDIEKIVDKNGNVFFNLSTPGWNRFERMYPISRLTYRGWDGKWRVVTFDINEERKKLREYLRTKLVSLGFGRLQESVYITPLDILVDLKEFLRSESLFGETIVFEAKELLGLDSKTIANHIWHLDQLSKDYDELVFDINTFKNGSNKQTTKKELIDRYFEILIKDPMLPTELLPDNWLGKKVKTLLSDL